MEKIFLWLEVNRRSIDDGLDVADSTREYGVVL